MNKIVVLILSVLLIAAYLYAGTVYDAFSARQTDAVRQQAIKLARWSVKSHIENKSAEKFPFKLDSLFYKKNGIFVTITKNGEQRGCMGTMEPVYENIAREIVANARKAAFSDPRRKPLSAYELNKIKFHVSIPGPLKPVREINELAPDRLGLLIKYNGSSGILLPGEAKTASWQIKECRRKAKVPPNAHPMMFVFSTVVFDENTITPKDIGNK